ncbi:DUF2270 domain-containing protein [Fluoribacter dumoffii]|uniref:Predicted integral membrane protein n=1 Tax=Fluoribacter dumoffii TaxID=463 RepID=A0A377G6N0_9GAMM|nr:DUF2270 domain-containing protein [Fluoribacter dumoffii]KTC92377.1 hypothetical protein Ldum_0183 [Fluoribacter dumoffii NY 23]MCW8386955.1 DUF2270 domain-containing protein [Fluoribacter dumoffii]MCW8417542.1 DUF2270 domain-containing protein [Fluoribacter dumoffii]MCW8454616.1 DUF2270 domain-containing protein [Fluoribacter dumoffii]MCW8461307.1 DUF2270 domain-containing protein [Fluoribacter dumoffii]
MEHQTNQSDDNFPEEFRNPPLPATSSELVTVLSHYYRGEIGRMSGWRDRIDRTTNWAITAAAAMLSLSLSTSSAHHGVLLFAMLLVLLLLFIESRRYRFFDVYRTRVRIIERFYFAPVFTASGPIKEPWSEILGETLSKPRFLMSLSGAMSRRLRRNYVWMFLILLLAWILKISSPKLQSTGARQEMGMSYYEIVGNAALGPIPGWIVILCLLLFYVWIACACLYPAKNTGELVYGEVHV